jgi:hypothetical protein
MNRNPKAKHYLSDAGQLNLCRLTDDAVAVLEDIHYNGVGLQRQRSQSHYLGKVSRIMEAAGYTSSQAWAHIKDQIKFIAAVNINAGE